MTYEELQIPAKRDGWVKSFEPFRYQAAMQLHSHRELEINLITRGEGAYFINGGKYPIREGMLVWLFPDQPHLLVEASEDCSMWVVVFRPRLIRTVTDTGKSSILRKRDPGSVFVQNVQGNDFRFLSGLCQRLGGIQEDDPYFNNGLAFLLRSSWEAGEAVASMQARGQVHPAVERVIHLMREGALDGPLPELARRAGISYSRLCSLFADQLGQSPGEFRTELRVRRFEYLMATHPGRTLLDIALEAGFGSYAQCHRTVSRITGRSPAELRKLSSTPQR
ncbi:MAG: helix-turn-helix transcriptional regulator [Puniceicoccaceae bacterium]